MLLHLDFALPKHNTIFTSITCKSQRQEPILTRLTAALREIPGEPTSVGCPSILDQDRRYGIVFLLDRGSVEVCREMESWVPAARIRTVNPF